MSIKVTWIFPLTTPHFLQHSCLLGLWIAAAGLNDLPGDMGGAPSTTVCHTHAQAMHAKCSHFMHCKRQKNMIRVKDT